MRPFTAGAVALTALGVLGTTATAMTENTSTLYITTPAHSGPFTIVNTKSAPWLVEIRTDGTRFVACDLIRADGTTETVGDRFVIPASTAIPCITWQAGERPPASAPVFLTSAVPSRPNDAAKN